MLRKRLLVEMFLASFNHVILGHWPTISATWRTMDTTNNDMETSYYTDCDRIIACWILYHYLLKKMGLELNLYIHLNQQERFEIFFVSYGCFIILINRSANRGQSRSHERTDRWRTNGWILIATRKLSQPSVPLSGLALSSGQKIMI